MADSRTVRSFASLAGGEALARVLAFAATLLVARRLGPAMYGVIGVASGIMLYLNQIADGGIELSGVPAVARQQTGIDDLVSGAITMRLMIAVALTTSVVALGVLVIPQPDGAILALYALGLVFVAAGVRWVFLGKQQSGWVATARISGELTALAIIAIALREVGDVAIVPIAAVTGAAVTVSVMLAGLRRLGVRPVISRRWEMSRALFARGPYLVGFTLLGLVLFNADLIYLRFISGQATAGYYAAAYTFIAFSANLSVAWAQSVMPAMARAGASPGSRGGEYATALLLAFAIALPVAAGGMIVASPLIELVFGSHYLPAVPALVWLLPVVPVAALREVVTAALITNEGSERQLMRINAVSALFNLVILIPIVPRYGATGAAAVTVLTDSLRLVIASRAAAKRGFTTPHWSQFAKPVFAAALMIVGLRLAGERPLVVQVAVGAVLYGAGLMVTGALRFGRPFRPQLVFKDWGRRVEPGPQ